MVNRSGGALLRSYVRGMGYCSWYGLLLGVWGVARGMGVFFGVYGVVCVVRGVHIYIYQSRCCTGSESDFAGSTSSDRHKYHLHKGLELLCLCFRLNLHNALLCLLSPPLLAAPYTSPSLAGSTFSSSRIPRLQIIFWRSSLLSL